MIYVETDEVLISGDLVQNKITPSAGFSGASMKSWTAVLDKVATMKIKTVLPTHSAPGEAGPMIAADRALFTELQSRGAALKRMGVSADDAAKQMLAELKEKHADVEIGFGFAGTVKKIYDEN